ncbi:unnamed protein product [Sphagnum tenellum]
MSNGDHCSENWDHVSETGDWESEVVEHTQSLSSLTYEALREWPASQQTSELPGTHSQKLATLHNLNDKLVKQVASLQTHRESLTNKVLQIEEELNVAKEAQEEIAALKIEHMNQMKENFDKMHVAEEENTSSVEVEPREGCREGSPFS